MSLSVVAEFKLYEPDMQTSKNNLGLKHSFQYEKIGIITLVFFNIFNERLYASRIAFFAKCCDVRPAE
jgi:hypothetical protein